MGCINKSSFSIFLFFISMTMFCFQLYWTYTLYTIELITETYFSFFRQAYTILLSISIFSFLQTSFTDPGFITHENNIFFIALYRVTRINCLERAKLYNEQTKRKIKLINENYESESDCQDDEYIFTKPQNNLQISEQYQKEFEIKTRLCPKCFIIRIPNVHHCPECHQCVYMLDHHCVWLNTCIGQFNQKFFILFCFYLLLASLIGVWMIIKYIIMINPVSMFENLSKGLSIFSFGFFHFAFLLFTIKLLFDQYSNFETNTIYYDQKECKMIEIRSKREVIYEVFGSTLSIWWFIPLTQGGLHQVINNIKQIK